MEGPEALRQLVHKLATTKSIDKVGDPVASKVADVVGHGPVKDALSGTWIGHPLHPLMTDLPIGFWTSSFMLDLVGGARSAAASQRLIGLGILSAVPTAAAGLSDWSDTFGEERRIGAVHAVANVAALSLYAWSWLARRAGRRGAGVTLGLLGATAATAGGYLGGHMVYRQGVGADRNAWKHAGDDWVDVAAAAPEGVADDDASALADGKPLVVQVDDDDVLLAKTPAGVIAAISNVCGHAGGPLNEGRFDAEGCVTCPWHGSVFRLADGHVVHGPATGHQPRYEVRSEGGRLLVRRLSSPV
jgi:nitrite reductase/ring-hydroxylating ferredoxin subunit/uncharacterized membrane protein